MSINVMTMCETPESVLNHCIDNDLLCGVFKEGAKDVHAGKVKEVDGAYSLGGLKIVDLSKVDVIIVSSPQGSCAKDPSVV